MLLVQLGMYILTPLDSRVSLQIKSQAEIDESMYFFIQTVLLVQKPDHLVLAWNA